MNGLSSDIGINNAAKSYSNESSVSQANHPEWDCLLIACQKGDASATKRILRENPQSNSHANPMGQSALHIAAWWNHVKCVDILLQHGANTEAINSFTGATPLHECLQSNQVHRRNGQRRRRIECISLLLEAKADIHKLDYLGRSPLECFMLADEDDVADHAEIKELIFANERVTKHPLQNLLQIAGSRNSRLEEIERIWCETISPIFDSDLHFTFSLLSTEILSAIEAWINRAEDVSEICVQTAAVQTDLIDNRYFLNHVTWVWDKLVEISFRIAKTHAVNDQLISGPCLDSIVQTNLSRLSKALFDRYEHLYKMRKVSSNKISSLLKSDAYLSAWIRITILLTEGKDSMNDKNGSRSSWDWAVGEAISQTWMAIARRDYFELAQLWWDQLRISPIGVVNRQGMTALQFAARSGHFRMVKWFINHPSLSNDDNVSNWIANRDHRGYTALAAAKANQHEQIVKLLQGYSLD